MTLEQARTNLRAIGQVLANDFPTDDRGRTHTRQPRVDRAFPPAFRHHLALSGTVR